jgi:protein TonB
MKAKKKNLLAFCFILAGFTSLYAQNNKEDSIVRMPRIIDNDAPPPIADSIKVYTMQIQTPPKFPGSIKQFLADNTKYPVEAKEKNIQGMVIVSFIIEKDGSISNITIIRSPDMSLSNEAKRLIHAMPKWSPGMQNGKPVRVSDSVPIKFKL